jgi:hypothetical protein
METALSTINQLPSGKDQVKVFIASVKNEILTAKDPLKILVQLKYAEKVIADILKDEAIDLCFLKEFELYEAEKEIEVNGAKLKAQEVGTKFDYNSSGDPVWFDLTKQIDELTEKRKERETFLKAIPLNDPGVVTDEGIFITRPVKSSKTKVVVKLG